MRLINTLSFRLEYFPNPRTRPRYAILSHTWTHDEISFQEFVSQGEDTKRQKRFSKIMYACAQAALDGYSYAWIDTCCIDKTSSSELTEAINSMFEWYRQSAVCYVYLTDVSTWRLSEGDLPWLFSGGSGEPDFAGGNFSYEVPELLPSHVLERPSESEIASAFGSSRWFSRGWTLQELLAPSNIYFYGRHWSYIGSLIDLVPLIKVATRIPGSILRKSRTLSSYSIARRMSWASKRQTTRIEDEAYCLLGIFGVYMPLLYGEGTNAFARLQKEIIQTSSDQSIFAWDAMIGTNNSKREPSYLADSAADFVESESYSPLPRTTSQVPYSITHRGLEITARVARLNTQFGSNIFVILDCFDERRPTRLLAIHVTPVDHPDYTQARDFSACGTWNCTFEKAKISGKIRRITIVNSIQQGDGGRNSMKVRCFLPSWMDNSRRSKTQHKLTMQIVDACPPGAWDTYNAVCNIGVSMARKVSRISRGSLSTGITRWQSLYAFTALISYSNIGRRAVGQEAFDVCFTILFWLDSNDIFYADVVSQDLVAQAGSLQNLCERVRRPVKILRQTLTETSATINTKAHVSLFWIKAFDFDAYDTLALVFYPRWSILRALKQDIGSVLLTAVLLPSALLSAFWSDLHGAVKSDPGMALPCVSPGLDASDQPADEKVAAVEIRADLTRLYGSRWRAQKLRALENVQLFLRSIRVVDREESARHSVPMDQDQRPRRLVPWIRRKLVAANPVDGKL